MSLVNIEKSRNSGSPVELYKFFSDSFTSPYFFTSAGYPIIYNGNTYVPVAGLKRGTIEIAKDPESNAITVSMDGANELAKKYIKYLPPKSVWLHIYRKHELDTDNEVVLYWQGKVSSVTHHKLIATFQCQPIISALAKNGLEYNFGPTCQHMLYDAGCKLNLATYTFNATILQVNSDILTSGAFSTFTTTSGAVPTGYWTTGFVTRSNGDVKYIIAHGTEISSGYNSSDIKLLTPFEDLVIGEVVQISAGCNHAFTTCDFKFNNTINFLGFPFIGENPFQKRVDL